MGVAGVIRGIVARRVLDSFAREMVRVTKPGGRIVMGNWIPSGRDGRAEALQAELEALFASQNRSLAGDRTSVDATFLRVEVAIG